MDRLAVDRVRIALGRARRTVAAAEIARECSRQRRRSLALRRMLELGRPPRTAGGAHAAPVTDLARLFRPDVEPVDEATAATLRRRLGGHRGRAPRYRVS